MDGWAKIKIAAKYAGVSERTFRDWLKQGLRYSQLNTGTILVKPQWIDEFLEGFEVKENEVDTIINEVLGEYK